jgi:Zn-dependent protease
MVLVRKGEPSMKWKQICGTVGNKFVDGFVQVYKGLQQCNSLLFIGFGIPVLVHWSLWVLLLFLLLFNPTYAITYVLVMLSIIPHEFGHALAARRYGIGCRKITLFPIGGIALLKEMPRQPLREFIVAGAGPAVTFALMVISFVISFLFGLDKTHQIFQLALINLVLFVFNMLPALPMDGGRMFRAFLGLGFSYLKATKIATIVSQVLCVLLIGLGIFLGSLSLVVVAFFVMMFAKFEYQQAEQAESEIKKKTI